MKKKSLLDAALKAVQLVMIMVAVAVLIMATANLKSGQSEQGREQLESSLRRSAMACYAIEGVYPPNVEYLEEHYGLQIDRNRYVVSYSAFAENLMPDITVLEKDV